MPSQAEVRQQITNKIVEALTNGNLPPWRKPWRSDRNAGSHANIISKRAYTGVNPLLLEVAANRHGIQSRWWATFRQWEQLGGRVMRRPQNVAPGEWGTQIVFCKPIRKTATDETGDERGETFFVLRTYTVFNIDQVQGDQLDSLRVGNGTLDTHEIEERFDVAERVIAATKADVRYGGNKAFYSIDGDFIQVPQRQQFALPEFYETVFHELCHWTEKRVGFDRSQAENTYALGELIAEMGGCFLATEIGLPTAENLGNHAAYLQGWLKGMNGDPKFIFRAAAQASKAVEFLLSFSRTSVQSAEPALA